ncbi:lytic polysaccharide monooxygenase [Streptomyces sp. JV176]|uniref:lytic polysaccharide monooxygenase auxiliary activity family 9 protein n=1 Tax=Streptomyces sp. JV176 TaxID=858630 RepID=UPI002E77ECFA|nr:lytic polysaccharide monooxygenase [Streptomyces sp. JV176]MEE1800248.1 lytic polysaccharide monooxygenase [Streptomyces sp. JV176]
MTARRTATGIVVLGLAPLALAGLTAAPAVAHGSMTDPVSRVAACFAEGPESPRSEACKAAVAASGTQAFYDWNEVNIPDAAGNHRQIIPDGKLCGAGRDKYKGLDLARADWPSSPMNAGNRTFRYKATAPHKGSFELYLTKDGYDPTQPLKWSDLEEKPFLTVTDPKLEDGAYVFDGVVPNRSGRHLLYSIWQRSDSPEAFYTCSDVVFGQDGGGAAGAAPTAAPVASAPTDRTIEEGTDKSSVDHNGHGGDAGHTAAPEKAPASEAAAPATEADKAESDDATGAPEVKAAGAPSAQSAQQPSGGQVNLAETGGNATTPYLAVGGAAALALGAAVTFGTVRRRAATTGRHGR